MESEHAKSLWLRLRLLPSNGVRRLAQVQAATAQCGAAYNLQPLASEIHAGDWLKCLQPALDVKQQIVRSLSEANIGNATTLSAHMLAVVSETQTGLGAMAYNSAI